MRKIFSLLYILTAVAACSTEQETTEVTVGESDVFIQLMSEFKSFDRSFGDCANDSSNTCTSVSITYPLFTGTMNPVAEKTINEEILSMLVDNMLYDSSSYSSLDEFSDALIGEYKEVRDEFSEAFGWRYEADVDILRNDTVALTLRFEKYMYTGGAHGMYAVWYHNFNPVTGAKYNMSDYFEPPFTDSLNARMKRAFLKEKGLLSDEDLSNAGYWFEDGQYYNENVALLTDSVIFYYNQYDIAPYAMGPTRMALPVAELRDLLKERFR